MTPAGHLGDRASELLDGRMPAEDEARTRRHLAGCRDCAALVRGQRAMRAALRRLDAPGAPPDLLAGLLALPAAATPPAAPTSRLPGPPRGRLATMVVGTVTLASAGALGIGAVAGLPGPGPRPAPAASTTAGGSPRPAPATVLTVGTVPWTVSSTAMTSTAMTSSAIASSAFAAGGPAVPDQGHRRVVTSAVLGAP